MSSWGDRATIKDLLKVISVYNAAADKFIHKVDNGLARSVETYNDLKAARKLASGLDSRH